MKERDILIVSGCDKIQEKFGKYSAITIKKYADKWGYDFKNYTGSDFYFTLGIGIDSLEQQTEKQTEKNRAHNWNKVSLVARNLDDYDYVLWLDSDVFVMNYSRSLEEIFELDKNEDKHFFLSPDAESLNVGVFLIKNSSEMHLLLREWCNMGFKKNKYYTIGLTSGERICFYEQAAFSQLYYKNWNNLMVLTQMMPPKRMNAHLQREFWRAPHCDYLQYESGKSFILHLAGVPFERRVEIGKKIVGGTFKIEEEFK